MRIDRLLKLGVLLGCLISLFPYSAPVRAASTYFFVSPTGQSGNPGTEESPLDLATALSATSPARPGDTIWLRGGVYNGTFTSYLAGTEDAPITVRQYPGERATIDSAPFVQDALTLRGSWTRYWGFEVMSSEPNRVSNFGGTPPDLTRGAGVTAFGHHLTLINLIVHDMGLSGLGIWTGSDDTEAYGNILYATGWLGTDRSHGHGLYTQSRFGVRRLTDNLIFNQFSHGIHAYGSGAAYLNNIQLHGNIIFNNGIFQPSNYERNILVGGDMGPESVMNPVAIENYTYYNPDRPAGRPNSFGYNGGCTNLVMRDNYIAHWTMNTLALSLCTGEVRGNFLLGYVDASYPITYPDNEYRHVPNGNNPPPEMRPTGTRVFVRPNRYEPGRAHIAVFNWDDLATVAVDLARANLAPGTPFEVRDVQDYFGPPLVSGTYAGGTIEIPMTTTAVSLPVGNVPPPSHSLPEFGAFVVIPTNYALPLPGPLASLAAAPATIEPGQSSTLSWTTSNSAQASIDQGIGAVALEGSFVVTPTETTTYTLTATTDSGQTKTDQVTVTVQVPNVPPTVDLAVAPGPFIAPATIDLSATAADTDGTIARVEFYVGSSRIGEDATAPFALQWTDVAPGTHVLTARATDNRDGETESSPITVVVAANIPPEVTLTVPAGTYIAPATIDLSASASDEDGTVARVTFYQGAVLLGEDTTNPYTFQWTNAPAGAYQLTARAVDDRSAQTVSSAIPLVILAPNTLPAVSLATVEPGPFHAPATMTLTAAVSDSDGTIAKVGFYQDGTLLGEDATAPYNWALGSVPAATYQFTARATDDREGQKTSLPITVVVNALPTVALTVPAGSFRAPETIDLSAVAADSDGTIGRVSFYQGTTWLGEDSSSPFTFRWLNVPAGTYQMTARAYDNRNGETISAPIAMVVAPNVPPSVTLSVPAGPLVAPAAVSLDAAASDGDGAIVRVAFYQGATKLGEDVTSPYSFVWANAPAGTFQLTARAFDDRGAETVSTASPLVILPPNVLPTVSLSATPTGTVHAPAAITLAASASDSDGIVKVEFYQGATRLGEDTTSPYTWAWASVPAGTYPLTARAYDNREGQKTSLPITVVVNALPTVALTVPGGPFRAPQTIDLSAVAADSDGTIGRVSFYHGTTRLGEDSSSPFTFRWLNVPAGTYQMTARAYDNRNGETISAPIAMVVAPNVPPSVTLSVPAGPLVAPAAVSLDAAASDGDGAIVRVAFYQGATKLGEDVTSPYSFVWANAPAGTFQLTARAFDDRGAETVSTASPLVILPPNVLPTVSLSATPTGTVHAPAAITLAASASDSDGIVKVEFYQGATRLGEDTTSPYTWAWASVPAGTYPLTARAYDNREGQKTSLPITVVVNALPTVALTVPGGPFRAPQTIDLSAVAADSDGTIGRVSFYHGTTRLGDDSSSPFTFRWLNVPAGTYQMTARAYDNRNGETISAPIAMVVAPNVPPSVTITVPAGPFTAPAMIDLTAAATDSDGVITRVAFYRNATLIAEDTTSPFTFSWSYVAAGTYQVTARAYDDRGGQSTSSAVTAVVQPPNVLPAVSLSISPGPYRAPVSITLTATASDSDGIARVEFYLGSTFLGEDSIGPYTLPVASLPAGTHQFTARAYDNRGGVKTSSVITIIVTTT